MSYQSVNSRSEHRSTHLFIRTTVLVGLLAMTHGLQLFIENKQSTSNQLRALSTSNLASSALTSTDLQQANSRLEAGDIIFRAGNSWLTHMAEKFSDSGVRYSHVGLITRQEGQLQVIHAAIEGRVNEPMGESLNHDLLLETLAEVTGHSVVQEPLADFLGKGNATQAVVYRLKSVTPEIQAAITEAAEEFVTQSTPFDARFDLTTPDQVYCSELIWRVYLTAGVDLADQGTESFAFPFSGRYITPDSLSGSVSLRPVYQFNQVHAVQSSLLP